MPRGPKTHHIVPNPNGGWDVKRGGGSQRRPADKPQPRDGRISGSDSYGNDPYPPKG